MLPEHDAFLRAIVANLYDDAPRFAFADWLDEHNHPERAEFIRLQCELEPNRGRYEIASTLELERREAELLWLHQEEWFGKLPEGWDDWQAAASLEFRRGFPDTLAMPVRSFLLFGAEMRQRYPTLRRVVLFRVNGYGERLAACDALEGLSELELACWYSMDDAEAISRSGHLEQLKVLVYWLGYQESNERHDVECCRVLGASNAWPNLRELTLLNPYARRKRARKQLVKIVNTAARRQLAVYRLGYPELFPFAADFWYTFPGYLPNGIAAMAAEDLTTDPPTLCVITFDRRGRQTQDVIHVPVPDDLLTVPTDEWFRHKDRLQQQLIKTLGFRPGFIRIQSCHFPGDEFPYYNTPGPEIGDGYGEPDTDDEESWGMEPVGNGGETWRHINNGDWVFGWDRFGDKRGRIHST